MGKSVTKHERLHYIDWLRILCVLLLVPRHTGWYLVLYPDFSQIQIDNYKFSTSILYYFLIFTRQWHLQLFFLIAGISTWYSLGYRKPREYILERSKRLLIPFIFGLLFISPLINLYFQFENIKFFLRKIYPDFLDRIYSFENIKFFHFWFLPFLFVTSLIALPVFIGLKGKLGQHLSSALDKILGKRLVIFVPGILLAIVQMLRGARLLYLTTFVIGYVICFSKEFWRTIENHLKLSSFLALIGISVVFYLQYTTGGTEKGMRFYTLYMGFLGLNTWFWLVALLGAGAKFFNSSNKLLKYLNEASYPLYIIHMNPGVMLVHYLRGWNIHIMIKFFIVVLLTYIGMFGFYELIIKRTNITRLLFGMRPKLSVKRSATEAKKSVA